MSSATTSLAGLTAAALFASIAVLGSATAAGAAPARLPESPGCIVNDFEADHTTGVVWWDIACQDPRFVLVDATAFSGTPDDHTIVDEQQRFGRVDAGETWHGVLVFETDTVPSIDQIRAQAVSFATEDPTESPAFLGQTNG
ncbi:hypothetical protein [Curtobacterium sp. Leaf261]|uniref:hypothetical protein n=1 Tax=Curtobacterium sp. Leaf261 TaxID=1736311 RepID=UPI0006F6AC61|nr:hypothetical protein [Curtobacterium sp. Leaf261]KQO60312.1 hypothetical protein ASF23_13860 [Curtobacterium sp. Leaf261]